MKTKNMKRTAWKRILEKEYTVRDCAPWGCPGRESLLQICRITEPLWVTEDYGRVCIADIGYGWVQIACHGQPYWLTAMFDRQGQFVQAYFDIAYHPCFDDPDDPTFVDLFLDVVLTSKMELVVLDRKELDSALELGEIDRETHDFALAACQKLLTWLEGNKWELRTYLEKTYQEMLEKRLG